MPLPGWLQQQAYEDYLAEEQSFQEWLTQVEAEYLYYDEYIIYVKPKRYVRPKRRVLYQ